MMFCDFFSFSAMNTSLKFGTQTCCGLCVQNICCGHDVHNRPKIKTFLMCFVMSVPQLPSKGVYIYIYAFGVFFYPRKSDGVHFCHTVWPKIEPMIRTLQAPCSYRLDFNRVIEGHAF